MKVCHVVSTFPRFEGDPEVPWLLEMVKGLVERGINVEIIAPSFRGLTSHKISGIPVQRFRYFFSSWEDLTHESGAPYKLSTNPLNWLKVIPYLISGTFYISWKHWEKRFDLLHVHWPIPHFFMSYPVNLLSGIPLILHFHSAEFPFLKKISILKPVIKNLMGKADYIIANSQYTGELIRKWIGRTALILPFGVKIREFAYQENTMPPYHLLFVGRLIERKGVQYLLHSLPQILSQTDVLLHIVGEGPERAKLITLARHLKVDKKVIFHGKIKDNQLHNLYRRCDLFILPSIYDIKGDTEGLGVVILEAMSYGKPVVATQVGGVVDIIKNGETGILVPQKDPGKLAEAVIWFLKNTEKRKQIARQGYEWVKRKFSYEEVIRRLIHIYKRATSLK